LPQSALSAINFAMLLRKAWKSIEIVAVPEQKQKGVPKFETPKAFWKWLF